MVVIDAHLVNDQVDLDDAHRRKIEYYQLLEDEVKNRFHADIIFTSVTLS